MDKEQLKMMIDELIKHADARKLEALSSCQKNWIQGYLFGCQQLLKLIEEGV